MIGRDAEGYHAIRNQVFKRITDRPAASVGIAQESYGRGCPLIVALPELLYSRRRERSQPGL